MKKIIKSLLVVLTIVGVCACTNKSDALKFKNDYESLNGVETKTSGKYYRTIDIDENNPFVYASMDEIVSHIENKESFIVYFGANWCPWCRSMLPTMIKSAKENGIKKIYYVDVRPDNDETKEIRDVYAKDDDDKIYLSHEGLESYHKFLEYAKDILNDYSNHGITLEGTEFEGQKRVGAPNIIYVENGTPKEKITGISEHQTDGYMDLTDEMIDDMISIFDKFFKNSKN